MKKTLASILLAVGVSAQAQTTTTTTTTAATATAPVATTETSIKPFAKSPFSFSLDTESYTERRKNEDNISKIKTYVYPQLSYKLAPNSIITAYANYVINRDDDQTITKYKAHNDYLAFRYTQEKILTEAEHGVDFKADARYYDHITKDSREDNEAEGAFNIRTYLDRKLTDKWTLNNHNRFWFFDKSARFSKATTPGRAIDLRLTPTFNATEKLSSGVEFQYLSYNVDDPSEVAHDSLVVTPNIGYVVNDKLSLLGELEFTPITSGDNEFLADSQILARPQFTYAFTDNISSAFIVEFPVLSEQGKYVGDEIGDNISVEVDFSIVAF